MVDHQYGDQRKFGLQPEKRQHAVPHQVDEPESQDDRYYSARCGDAIEQLSFHDFETLLAGIIFSIGMIDVKARQVE